MKAKDKKIAELEREAKRLHKEYAKLKSLNGKNAAFEMLDYTIKIEKGIALTAEEAKRYESIMKMADLSVEVGKLKKEIKIRQAKERKSANTMTDAEKREYYLRGMQGAAEKKKRAAAQAKAKEEQNKDEGKTE